MTRVSAIVNNRDYGRFLRQALESALAQEHPGAELEVVVVDDASTDDSREVLASFAGRVKIVLRPSNGGQAAAFNDGIAAATGDVLCLLDSDDWWAPGKVKRVLERFAAEPDLGMVQHWCQEIGPDGRPFATRLPRVPPRWTADDFRSGRAIFTGTTGLSFRRAALERLLPVPSELRICADVYLYYSALERPVGNIEESLAFRRVHGANRYAARLAEPGRLAEHRRVLEALDRLLEKRLPGGLAALDPAFRRRQLAEQRLEDLLLARYAGNWSGALAAWRSSLECYDGAAKLAKGASLLLAVLWPASYLALQGLYARLRNG